jgi:hypothetical protein
MVSLPFVDQQSEGFMEEQPVLSPSPISSSTNQLLLLLMKDQANMSAKLDLEITSCLLP